MAPVRPAPRSAPSCLSAVRPSRPQPQAAARLLSVSGVPPFWKVSRGWNRVVWPSSFLLRRDVFGVPPCRGTEPPVAPVYYLDCPPGRRPRSLLLGSPSGDTSHLPFGGSERSCPAHPRRSLGTDLVFLFSGGFPAGPSSGTKESGRFPSGRCRACSGSLHQFMFPPVF